MGAGKRLNGRGKKSGEEKSRKKVGAPGILLLTDQGPVSRKSRNFSGVFRVTQFSLYLQNEGVSRHETLQLFLFLFPLQHMKRQALQNKQVIVLRLAFRARKVLGTFEKRAPVPKTFKILACDWAQKYFLCPIRVQLFSCYFRDFLFEHVHRQTFCSPDRYFNIYLLVQESFPRSKSAIETTID